MKLRIRRWQGWIAAALGATLAAALALDRAFPPDLSRYEMRSRAVLDRHGQPLRLFTAADDAWRFEAFPHEVSPNYLRMLISVEDKRYYAHPGVDPLAVLRAVGQLATHGRVVSGASTLTMQTARLLEPRPRSLLSKLLEMARALQLEWRLSKNEILGIYLTLAPMGGNLEGVKAASLAWFGKEPRHLSDAEAALLVALPQSPTRLRPDNGPQAARIARDRILGLAKERGVIDDKALASARAAPLPDRRRPMPMLAAHLSERLVSAETTGQAPTTTIDSELQARVERVMADALHNLPVPINIAAIVADHRAHEVRAWAGSGDYLDQRRFGMIDLARAIRSPGSTLKPFVYGLAFESLLAHPASLVRDGPTRFEDYAPGNFSGGFDGDVTVREALQRSLNLPAVTVLDRLGPVAFLERMRGAGIPLATGDANAAPGLPIVLGGIGATLVDLVTAYGALASDGVVRPLRLQPKEPAGDELRLMDEPSAAAVRDILAGILPPGGVALDGRRIGYKTGTSYRFRDGWAVGFDGGHVIGVWVGRPDGGSCRPCSGAGSAAPLLFRLFDQVPYTPLLTKPAAEGLASAPPPALRRLDKPNVHAERRPARPRIVFPVAGASLLVRGSETIPLKVEGGERPYRWLLRDKPLGAATARKSAHWEPEGIGFVEITVVDAAGLSDRVQVRVVGPQTTLSTRGDGSVGGEGR